MKEKILKNWGLKIMAVLISFLVWFLVANIEDYSITKTITGIPVVILNEEAITDQEMVYEIVQGKTVDIKVEGRRSVVEKLSADDFTASANLSELSITNSVQIAVEAVSASVRREISISIVDSMMKVAIEERGEQKLPISVLTVGETQEGYAVVSSAATPNMVTISGAASKVRDVKTVRVEVDVEGLNAGFTTRGELILLDADGAVIMTDKIEMNHSTVTVKVSIQKTKEVPIQVTPTGEVAEGYSVSGDVEYQPTTVLIAGDEELLRSVREISIDNIDITGQNSNYETTVDINDYLPEGIVVADRTQEIAIKINIEKLVERVITLKPSDIRFIEGSEDLEYQISEEEPEFQLTVTGLKADLDALTIEGLEPVVNVSAYTSPGDYKATVELKEFENIQYGNTITVTVAVTRKEATTEKPSGLENSTATSETGSTEE